MKYVIIGNSAAGIAAVESIRKNDTVGEITVITDEAYHTYSRPLISYLLLGKTTEERMKYRDNDFYEKNNVRLVLSKKAVKINPDQKSVQLDDGTTESYDKLLVATGSSPFVPPMAGLENVSNKCTFSSLADAKKLESLINEKSKVLIIGAGLIGLKCAEGILKRVAEITVVDLAPRVLSSILDEEAGKLIKSQLEEHGLKFFLGDSVKEFTANTAALTSGTVLDFDAVVLAVGVRPNVDLLKDIGANIGRGITIDEHMQTSISDIYSAGDCTESVDVSTGVTKIMALLPNAYIQGECAGYNMSGINLEFKKAIPMNAIGFFGTHIITAGNYVGDVYLEQKDGVYRKLYYADNRLNGFLLIGPKADQKPAFAKAGIYTSLIREGTPLDSLDFGLICKNPGLLPFSREARDQKLSGAV